jgi:hypothetical protein
LFLCLQRFLFHCLSLSLRLCLILLPALPLTAAAAAWPLHFFIFIFATGSILFCPFYDCMRLSMHISDVLRALVSSFLLFFTLFVGKEQCDHFPSIRTMLSLSFDRQITVHPLAMHVLTHCRSRRFTPHCHVYHRTYKAENNNTKRICVSG